MDILQEYSLQALHLYQQSTPYLSPILTPIYTTVSTLRRTAYPLLLPYINTALTYAQTQPAVVSVFLFLATLYIALRILGFVQRIIAFWVGIVMRLLFWGAIGVMISMVYQRGVERTLGDLIGWGRVLGEVWLREYKRWEGYQKQAGQGRDAGGGGAYGRDYVAGSRGNTGWR